MTEGSSTSLKRLDLQGLRAVAVLAVVAYHFGVPGASGGFIGVDVFFVLSGFFITYVLYRDVEKYGRVRLGKFLANRAKRLLPNGLLVILTVIICSALFLPAYRMPGISDDALSATAFFANIHFAVRAVDYFHLDDPASPLLHFWSLAVEEQFYLVLPLLLTGIAVIGPRRYVKPAVVAAIASVAVISFASAVVVIDYSQPKAFYFPQYRAWQLATGGILALTYDTWGAVPRILRTALAIAGLGAISLSITMLSDETTYPGFWALAPTLGTAAVVFGLDASPSISRMLSLPPMVTVGDMSYSLYLWHWPVAVFLLALSPVAGVGEITAGLAIAFLIAAAAYVLVERPIHHMSLPTPVKRRRVLAMGASAISLVAATSVGAAIMPSHKDPVAAELIAKASEDRGANYTAGCHRRFDDVDQPPCHFGHLGGSRVVLFGDSHAAQWFPALLQAAETAGWELETWTKTSCPAADVRIWFPPNRAAYQQCAEWREARMRELLKNPPALVVLGNYANYYGWILDPATKRAAGRHAAEALWQMGMERTGHALTAAGISVVEMRDTPRMHASYKDCLSTGQWQSCQRPRAEALQGMDSPLIASDLYSRLDLSDVLCTSTDCPAAMGGDISYWDSNHLTASRARSLYGYLLAALQQHSRATTSATGK